MRAMTQVVSRCSILLPLYSESQLTWYIDVSITDCCLSLQARSYAIFPTYSKFAQNENEMPAGCSFHNTRVEVRNDVVHMPQCCLLRVSR